ncbi:uncharacterized protein LOC115030845 isoform X2 [Mus caroli]|uniref:Uncharacterized protein LOC115030845 isoform X2 n=1 Tax=Mus caroli TaxID=10089 RepID=A0A6P7QTN0_MUSCR|nr:uncharacterized protein LOC115030845 isoform X2 [Mus caroli]
MEKDGRFPPGPQLLGQQEVERSSCGPQPLESWLGAALWGHRTGPREALQPLGPKQQRLEAWAAGKGKVTSLPPGICCLEASPWRPEGSGIHRRTSSSLSRLFCCSYALGRDEELSLPHTIRVFSGRLDCRSRGLCLALSLMLRVPPPVGKARSDGHVCANTCLQVILLSHQSQAPADTCPGRSASVHIWKGCQHLTSCLSTPVWQGPGEERAKSGNSSL